MKEVVLQQDVSRKIAVPHILYMQADILRRLLGVPKKTAFGGESVAMCCLFLSNYFDFLNVSLFSDLFNNLCMFFLCIKMTSDAMIIAAIVTMILL